MTLTVEAETEAQRAREDAESEGAGAGRPVRWLRILVLLLLGAAFVPSVMPFSVDLVDDERVCVPIVHGWHGDRGKPSDADFREVTENLTLLPSPDAMRDPTQRAAWLAAEAERTSTPGYRRVEPYLDWIGGPGACVPESRHRLILTGTAVAGALGVAPVTIVMGRRGRPESVRRP